MSQKPVTKKAKNKELEDFGLLFSNLVRFWRFRDTKKKARNVCLTLFGLLSVLLMHTMSNWGHFCQRKLTRLRSADTSHALVQCTSSPDAYALAKPQKVQSKNHPIRNLYASMAKQ